MPIRIIAGRTKFGRKKECTIPVLLYGPRGEHIPEYALENSYRDLMRAKLFSASGKEIGGRNAGATILAPNGKPVNQLILERYSRAELAKALAKMKRETRGMKRETLKIAGRALSGLLRLGKGEEEKAIKILVNNSFFRTAMLEGKLDIPFNSRISVIKSFAEDYFFDVVKKDSAERKILLKIGGSELLRKKSDLIIPGKK
ncbi:MAG: hypothetical protein NTZ73_02780 [Candidatus Diapherotrites archaeon]|nr:hypothetical protein [Candidatus Diapherotrites archaeon]